MKITGIVYKITGSKCIIMTKDGEFRRVSLPSGPVRVGQEVTVSTFALTGWTKYATLAACLLLALAGVFTLQQPAAGETVAYVSLDINPSMELAVDSHLQVADVKALNEDSRQLLDKLVYKKKNVYLVISDILQKAIDLDYVSSEKSNLVVSTVYEVNPKYQLDAEQLEKAVAAPLKVKHLKAGLLFLKATPQEHAAASKLKLSTGKYLFYRDAAKSQNPPTLREFQGNSIASLVKAKKIKIPRNRARIFIPDTEEWTTPAENAKKAPGQLKKLNHWQQVSEQDDLEESLNRQHKSDSDQKNNPVVNPNVHSGTKKGLTEKDGNPSKEVKEKQNLNKVKQKQTSSGSVYSVEKQDGDDREKAKTKPTEEKPNSTVKSHKTAKRQADTSRD
ncbi:MAG TPA: anti-sigma factor domain-containing protein [Bacillota bacterium]|nr:anti-sigma factor domain-containing protein [Bacillota bacterium]